MILINSQFLKVVKDEVQDKIDKKITLYQTLNRDAKLIFLNKGDVVRPLAPCVVDALTKAVSEMGSEDTFQGRSPAQGFPFLLKAIVKFNQQKYKIKLDEDEIFVNHGAKEDLGGIGDILCRDNRLAVLDPVFQTYIESNVIGNRAGELSENSRWSHIIYLECKKENGFMPEFPEIRPDVIYFSYPNDPTGCAMDRTTLEKWVKYAIKNNILILYDATYKSFSTGEDIPKSIYEIKGAKKIAIEFRSFSKNAGFTGLHCGYTVIPKEISGYSFSCDKYETLNTLWRRRQQIKNYSPSYVIQRGAEALFTEAGLKYISENVAYYMSNARILVEALQRKGFTCSGGVDSPFIWVESPYQSSWKLFDKLLEECQIVCSPGERFGPRGAGYVRLSAFGNQTKMMLAASRIMDMDI